VKLQPMNVVNLMIIAVIVALAAMLLPKSWAQKVADFFEPWEQKLEGAMVMYGVENHKSTIVTNADATPVDLTNPLISHGRLRSQVAKKEIAAADDNDTVVRLHRVWSGWRIEQWDVGADALSTGAVYEAGVYQTAENGGAVVDADEFGASIDLSAATAMTDITYDAVATEIDKIEMPLWERIGLTADPKRWYDLALTATGAGTAAGTIASRLRYVDGT